MRDLSVQKTKIGNMFPKMIRIASREQIITRVMYVEVGISLICFFCCQFFHSNMSCREKKKESAIAQLRRYDLVSIKWPSCIISPSKFF